MPLPIPGPGRPPTFSDPEVMWEEGLGYFTKENKPWAISELAEHLGLSYWCFCDYEKKPAFHPIVKRLKGFVLTQAEKGLYDKDTVTGSKFHASVLGMNEKTIVEQTSQNTNLNVNAALSLEHLTDDQIGKLADAIALVTNLGADRSGTPSQIAQQNQKPIPGNGSLET